MKIRITNTDYVQINGFTSESYNVIYYGSRIDSTIMYGVFNDDLRVCNLLDSSVVIVDDDKTNFIQRDELNWGRTFFIDSTLFECTNLQYNYLQLESETVWFKSKLIPFFINNNYKLTETFKNTALNENYKLNLIEGYLMFVNRYISPKFIGGHYFERLDFYKANSNNSVAEIESASDLTKLDKSNYNTLLINHISSALYEKEFGEEQSQGYISELFSLINSIFIEEIDDIYSYQTHYDSCLVIKYKDELYYLNKNWEG